MTDLKTTGLKATAPRLRILKLFESARVRHMSAEDVYRTLMAEGVDVGLAVCECPAVADVVGEGVGDADTQPETTFIW